MFLSTAVVRSETTHECYQRNAAEYGRKTCIAPDQLVEIVVSACAELKAFNDDAIRARRRAEYKYLSYEKTPQIVEQVESKVRAEYVRDIQRWIVDSRIAASMCLN